MAAIDNPAAISERIGRDSTLPPLSDQPIADQLSVYFVNGTLGVAGSAGALGAAGGACSMIERGAR
jgi:hypothetical protein